MNTRKCKLEEREENKKGNIRNEERERRKEKT
jgi:hypothetical protein